MLLVIPELAGRPYTVLSTSDVPLDFDYGLSDDWMVLGYIRAKGCRFYFGKIFSHFHKIRLMKRKNIGDKPFSLWARDSRASSKGEVKKPWFFDKGA
jgi:hypothetical protein